MEKYMGFSDVAVNEDSLGIDDFCKGLADFIKKCPTPITVAVQGGWGTGKSSVMKIIEEKVKDEVCSVDFNSWKYAKTAGESLILPLIREFERKITQYAIENNISEYTSEFNDKESTFKKLLYGATGALYFTGRGIVEWLTSKISAANTSIDIVDRAEKAMSEAEEKMISLYECLDNLHNGLDERIRFLCETGKPGRIVVFIDDLDRIAPKDAVNLLEDMKNIMDFENCVFVLALDNAIVQRGLKEKYGNELEKEYAERFFDKLIQLPFTLPLNLYNIDRYIRNLNDKCTIGSDKEIEDIVDLLKCAGIVNPRAIKRLLNTLQLYKKTSSNDMEGMSSKYFAIIILQSEYKNSYDSLLRTARDWSSEVVYKALRGKYWEWKEVTDCFDEDISKEYIEILKKLFDPGDFSFIDALMNTTLTGNGEILDREIMTQEIENVLTEYVEELFGDWEEYNDYGRHGREKDGKRVYVTIPGHSSVADKHVNLQINYDKVKLVQGDEPLEKLQNYTGKEVNEKPDDEIITTQLILYSETSFCIRNLSPDQIDYLEIAGRFLRNFKENGSLLPP